MISHYTSLQSIIQRGFGRAIDSGWTYPKCKLRWSSNCPTNIAFPDDFVVETLRSDHFIDSLDGVVDLLGA